MAINFVDLLYPRYCLSCRKEGEWVCPNCFESLTIRRRPAEGEVDLAVEALLDYDEALAEKIITVLKYNFVSDLSRVIDSIVLKAGDYDWSRESVIVPVPLHRRRLLWRGFNQAEIIALALTKATGLPVCADLLLRTVYRRPQVGRKGSERARSVQGVFAVNYQRLSDNWGKNIILVDDVMTTGSTLGECARTLQTVGFKEIKGFVLAA